MRSGDTETLRVRADRGVVAAVRVRAEGAGLPLQEAVTRALELWLRATN